MSETVTIGRNPKCTIKVDSQWDTVSNNHADIQLRGNILTFFDHSTNGTLINGQKVHNTSVGIYPGDDIRLAGVFPLSWDVIDHYFPQRERPTVTNNIHGQGQNTTGRHTVRLDVNKPSPYDHNDSSRKTEQFHGHNDDSGETRYVGDLEKKFYDNVFGQANKYSQAEIDKYIQGWNWGAFFASWLWGLFNKVYWPVLILLVSPIPYLGQVAALCLSIYLGVEGNKLAWSKENNRDFASFKKRQNLWTIIGAVLFALNIIGQFLILQQGLLYI